MREGFILSGAPGRAWRLQNTGFFLLFSYLFSGKLLSGEIGVEITEKGFGGVLKVVVLPELC